MPCISRDVCSAVRTGICIVHQVVWGWRQLLGVAQGLSGLQEIVSRCGLVADV
jgi:hypothetical protein